MNLFRVSNQLEGLLHIELNKKKSAIRCFMVNLSLFYTYSKLAKFLSILSIFWKLIEQNPIPMYNIKYNKMDKRATNLIELYVQEAHPHLL